MTFQNFIKELNGNRIEGEIIKSFFYSIVTSAASILLFWFVLSSRFSNISLIKDYGYFIFFAILSYAIIIPTIRQVRSYCDLPCMIGMMVGMTTGMISGFLPGFFVASTNGMFVGSVFGMAIGIILGIWNGKCCGVMGIIEGIMAGFMGGLMGAMTSFMLLNDNLKIATVLVFIISAVIMTSLNYAIYKEMKEGERKKKEDHFWTIAISFILTTITLWLMIFGPKSGLFQ